MLLNDLMDLSMFSILPPSILGVVWFRKLPTTLKILVLFILAALLLEVIAYVLFLNARNNMFVFHIHTYLEFSCFALIYYRLTTHQFIKLFIQITSFLFIVFSVFYTFQLEFIQLNPTQRLIEAIILVVFFFLYFAETISNNKIPFVEWNPFFLLTIGLLIYFVGTTLIFISLDEMNEFGNVSLWAIHSLLNVMLNIFYTIVIWRSSKR